MIDIHTHILPGIDDGAQDIYDTLEMVRMAADSGVTAMVATPHCNIPGGFDNYFGREYVEVFQKTVKAVQRERIPIQLLPGMEVFSTYDLPELIVEKKIMPLNQSRYILMEFAFDEEPEFAQDIVDRVREVGAKPVIAHAERYEFVQDDPQIVYEWRKKGYLVQINKGSFLGRFGRRAQAAAYRMMDHNLVSVIASDAHSPYQRTPYMLDAYEELRTEYSERCLKVLFEENPRRICENQNTIRFALRSFEEED
ncbi:MAG: hypothetical protein Q4C52_08715 [Eubacteriales bacterium]|nr:hypothetical protein [Eubacteriales bacterium]